MASVSKRKWTSPQGEPMEAWIVRYMDDGGAYRQRTFKKKKEADTFRVKAEGELARGTHVATSQTVTVAKLTDAYLAAADERLRAGRRMSTSHHATLNTMFRCHVLPHIGAVRLIDLTFERLDDWGRTLSAKPSLSPSTVKRVLHLFKVAIDFAVRRGWVHRNLVADVMRDYRGGRREPIRSFTEEEARALLAEANVRPRNFTQRATDRVRCMVYLGALCGLRIGEITGLKVENIDCAKGVVKVRHSLTDRDELKGPKTHAGIRDVPMPAIVVAALRDWLAHWYADNERGLVFRMAGGGFQSPQNFHANYWRKLLERAGLGPDEKGRRFHFHALRHFYASMLVNANVPLSDVASLLGHSSFDVTLQVYTHTIASGRQRLDVLEGIANSMTQPLLVTHECRMAA